MAWYKCKKGSSLELVPWSTGTDAEIKAMVDAYYAGDLSLEDIQSVWHVGDERSVNLSAMGENAFVSDTHAAQTVTFVIMNFGGKKLASNGTTEILAIIGQKEVLAELGAINDSNSTRDGWYQSKRRSWCNLVYRNAIPEDLRALFKQVSNYTSLGSSGNTSQKASTDYFALPSEKEILGTTSKANRTAETKNSQFAYYVAAANKIKYYHNGSSPVAYWTRSPQDGSDSKFVSMSTTSGYSYAANAGSMTGLAPFGCI